MPKISCPSDVADFRSIACCIILYKCITKLLSEKLNKIYPDLISPREGDFMAGRSILNNILICQDLVTMYRRKTLELVA